MAKTSAAKKGSRAGGTQGPKIVGGIIVIVFIAVVAFFFLSSAGGSGTEIPSFVTGETREVYEFAKTAEGNALFEQLPCYCGCKFEGHKHERHCFWKDNGNFDKHGITCSVCLDIGIKAMQMHEEGRDVCEIRKSIDDFYAPNAHLGTQTPYPEGCVKPEAS